MAHQLIETWMRFAVSAPPFILEEDKKILTDSELQNFNSHENYIESNIFCYNDDKTLHTGLYPIPYSGHLDSAHVFLLQLNPGLSPGDYFAEYRVPEFREAQARSLKQSNANDEFPFIYLDPNFCWHPGFVYWQRKLHKIISKLQKKENTSYQQAASVISKKIALLELLPYHSRNFGAGNLLKKLPSVKLIQSYVHEILIPKARQDQISIVVMRQAEAWGLSAAKNIVVYGGSESRAAHLSPDSRGGKAIVDRLDFN